MFENFEQAARISLPAILDVKPGQTQNLNWIKIIFLVLVDKLFFIKHLLLTSGLRI